MDFLVKFFNVLFDRGIHPDSWTESIIIPLFKKGNQNDPNNYSGISLCDISSKLYSLLPGLNAVFLLSCLFLFFLIFFSFVHL